MTIKKKFTKPANTQIKASFSSHPSYGLKNSLFNPSVNPLLKQLLFTLLYFFFVITYYKESSTQTLFVFINWIKKLRLTFSQKITVVEKVKFIIANWQNLSVYFSNLILISLYIKSYRFFSCCWRQMYTIDSIIDKVSLYVHFYFVLNNFKLELI